MKKPPKRLVIKPGRYRTRDRNTIAIITHRNDTDKSWPWNGTFAGGVITWCENGRHLNDRETSASDLMERIEDAQPKPAKRERMKLTDATAKRITIAILLGMAKAIGETCKEGDIDQKQLKIAVPIIKRVLNESLPMLPATRKEKS